MRIIKFLLLLLIVLMGTAFAIMNPEKVTLNYYFGSREFPLSLVLVGTLALGALLGMLATAGGWFRLKRKNVRLTKEVRQVSRTRNDIAGSH